jgi:hypothetical protein
MRGASLAYILGFWSLAAGCRTVAVDGHDAADDRRLDGLAREGGGRDLREPTADAPMGNMEQTDGPDALRDARQALDAQVPREACGDPNGPCCEGNSCKNGGCCISGRCVPSGGSCAPIEGTCQAGSCGACGGLGQTCCAGSTCTGAGTACLGSVCARCGGAGDPCCAPAAGSSDTLGGRVRGVCSVENLVCGSAGRCVGCGNPSEPCCPGSACRDGSCCFADACVGSGQACGSSGSTGMPVGGTCSGGRCSACGGRDQQCCGFGTSGNCYEPNQTCRTGRCTNCGGPGETCCPPTQTTPACTAGFICAASANLCQKCGGPGEPCCPGSTCSGANCCLAGRCHLAGDTCRIDSVSFGVCQDGRCGCGKLSEPCCPQTAGFVQPRCTDPDTACTGGSFSSTGTCAKCGGPGAPCCPGQLCNEPGLACLGSAGEGICQRCGGPGELCCPGTVRCNGSDTVCVGQSSSARCVKCGTASPTSGGRVPCCAGNQCRDGSCCVNEEFNTPFCVAVNSSCLVVSGVCGSNGSCGGCGGVGQPCCSGRYCTGSGTMCSSTGSGSTCIPCGRLGQPCCSRYSSSALPPCEGSLKCTQVSGVSQCTQ